MVDAGQEGSDTEVAIGDPELAGFDEDLIEQRPLLAIGILMEHHVEDHHAGRFVDGQGHARQTCGAGAAQRSDPMLGPGQDGAIEDAGGIARDRLVSEAPDLGDQSAQLRRDLADDSGGEGRSHPIELAVERLGRGDLIELMFEEGRVGGRLMTQGDIEHGLDQMGQGQLPDVLVDGDFIEEAIDRVVVEDPIEDESSHRRGGTPFGEGIEDGRKDHESLLGCKREPSSTKEFTAKPLHV